MDERTKIDNEQRRKEQVRDSLAEILPWETRDAEMEILVDECREVILGLSSSPESFTGPFVLPGGLQKKEKDDEDEDDEDDENVRAARDLYEAEKSAEKLSKLQPLPALLADFDLDTHVGLIQRLFQADPKLVEVHSKLSSGGAREVAFWKNYFFHCAFARYEAGLSIDEIWSNDPKAPSNTVAEKEEEPFYVVDTNTAEEEVVFDDSNEGKTDAKQSASVAATALVNQSNAPAATIAEDSIDVDLENLDSSPADSSGGTSYDFVPEASGEDGEIDELEAEIAAALGD